MEDNAMIDMIGQAQNLLANGDREGARSLYNALWAEATRFEDLPTLGRPSSPPQLRLMRIGADKAEAKQLEVES